MCSSILHGHASHWYTYMGYCIMYDVFVCICRVSVYFSLFILSECDGRFVWLWSRLWWLLHIAAYVSSKREIGNNFRHSYGCLPLIEFGRKMKIKNIPNTGNGSRESDTCALGVGWYGLYGVYCFIFISGQLISLCRNKFTLPMPARPHVCNVRTCVSVSTPMITIYKLA